jgi:hypothetical protein
MKLRRQKMSQQQVEDSVPSLTALGLDDSEQLYAYCYCEENVHRAIRRVLAATGSPAAASVSVSAVVISSYAVDDVLCFPGSWLPVSRVLLTMDPSARKPDERFVSWDYHVIMLIETTSSGGGSQCFVADFDSTLSNGGKRGRIK